MICQRCRGLLVHETFGDLREESGCMCPATRCINCGYIEDSVVRANRLRPPYGKTVDASRDRQAGRSRVPKTSL